MASVFVGSFLLSWPSLRMARRTGIGVDELAAYFVIMSIIVDPVMLIV